MHILLIIIFVLLVSQYGWFKGPVFFAGSWLLGLIAGIVIFIFGLALLLALGGMFLHR